MLLRVSCCCIYQARFISIFSDSSLNINKTKKLNIECKYRIQLQTLIHNAISFYITQQLIFMLVFTNNLQIYFENLVHLICFLCLNSHVWSHQGLLCKILNQFISCILRPKKQFCFRKLTCRIVECVSGYIYF